MDPYKPKKPPTGKKGGAMEKEREQTSGSEGRVILQRVIALGEGYQQINHKAACQ